jgi:hypothetical protein
VGARVRGAATARPARLPGLVDRRRIEGELRRFTGGPAVFPTQREFRVSGQSALLGAMRRHGGVDLWAAKIGLPRLARYSGKVPAI